MKKNYIIIFVLIIIFGLVGYLVFKLKKELLITTVNQPTEEKTKLVISSEEPLQVLQNEIATALIKDIYLKDTKYYVVLDYVTVRKNESMNNLDLVNLNNKLRTFELNSNTKIELIRYPKNSPQEQSIVKAAELYRILKNNREDYYGMYYGNEPSYGVFYQAYTSPFSVKVDQGKLIELKQIYQE